jgi:prepilin-type N-terminal cleavage/methylation domain-containing protein
LFSRSDNPDEGVKAVTVRADYQTVDPKGSLLMPHMNRERGFTLLELLVTVAIAGLLLTLSAGAARVFWLQQSIDGAANGLTTQLREQQEDSVSQAHPLIFGVGVVAGSPEFTLYRFDPGPTTGTADDSCSPQTRRFNDSMFSLTPRVKTVTVTNDVTAPEYVKCSAAWTPSDSIIFFYARGTSTGGTIVLEQPGSSKERTVTVSVATGRVTRT